MLSKWHHWGYFSQGLHQYYILSISCNCLCSTVPLGFIAVFAFRVPSTYRTNVLLFLYLLFFFYTITSLLDKISFFFFVRMLVCDRIPTRYLCISSFLTRICLFISSSFVFLYFRCVAMWVPIVSEKHFSIQEILQNRKETLKNYSFFQSQDLPLFSLSKYSPP